MLPAVLWSRAGARRMGTGFLVALLVALGVTAADAALGSRARITTAGVGPIRIGMTADQARRAAGRRITVSGEVSPGCASGRLYPRRFGVSFLLTRGRIQRIYIARRGIATKSGVRVGDSTARLRRIYGKRLVVRPGPYSRRDRLYELRFGNRKVTFFSIRNRRVNDISTGRKPEIDYIEGCA